MSRVARLYLLSHLCKSLLGALSGFLVTDLKILFVLFQNIDEADTVVPGGHSPPPASDVIVIKY